MLDGIFQEGSGDAGVWLLSTPHSRVKKTSNNDKAIDLGLLDSQTLVLIAAVNDSIDFLRHSQVYYSF